VTRTLHLLLRAKFNCVHCPDVLDCRSQVVLPEVHKGARVLLLGRNPGGCEDAAGVPFVGPGGDLLNDWLDLIGLSRSLLVVENIVGCWTPGDREPTWEEIDNCRIWLNQEIKELHELELIIPMGKQACAAALGKKSVQMKAILAKELPSIWGISCFPIHHPGYALRNGKADEDMRIETLPKLRELLLSKGLLSGTPSVCAQ